MKIIPLSEGSFTVAASKGFLPFDPDTDHLEERPKGSLLVEIQPFVLITSRDIILLDAGLGLKGKEGIADIHRNLMAAGIAPGEVTRVLVSHLHKDHAGGLTMEDGITGIRHPAFAQAVYYINKRELEYAFAQNGKSYHAADFASLTGSDQLITIDGSGTIEGYIRYELTGGHCPYHQVFWVEEEEKVFFGGDIAPQISQMKNRFIANYDYDGRLSMELRGQFAEKGKREGWIFLFYHDTRLPFARLDRE
ncbi:MAG TPA: MBL fold metallo-hydrolase [Chitinophagaceae bacterium]|nr:MBL fold metallo-hydrolase [Chitinophagaceae bacterium]